LAGGIISYFSAHKAIDPRIYQEDLLLKELEMDPSSSKATADPDTLYLHEAMKAPEAAQFKEARKKEALWTKKGHCEVIRKLEVARHSKLLPAMRRIESREAYKPEARLNLGGNKQECRVHYHETYSPVVRWTSIRLMMTLSIIRGWSTQQLDFVTQADISTNLAAFEGGRDTHCLHVHVLKNIYGGKDAGRTWNQPSIESVQMQLIDSVLAVLKSVEHGGCNQAKTYKHDGKVNNDEAVRIIGKYLLGTWYKGFLVHQSNEAPFIRSSGHSLSSSSM
jgi:Reverse transcriptase (RNA-dependent DNA polymerase)